MNAFIYRLSYTLGMSNWDTDKIPSEVEQAFQVGDIPEGPVLDLGCGTGTSVIFMAKQGRQAIGIDFVPQAIAKAQKKARQAGVAERTKFMIADVTRIKDLNLPACGFALDMGCFHGLSPAEQCRYAQGLADVLVPDGRYMLYVMDTRKEMGISFGITANRVQEVFSPWFAIERTQRGAFWDRRSTWFWMKKK